MLRGNWGYIPEDLRPNEHEDVLDDFIETGDEEVWPKSQAQCPEQGRLLCLMGFFNNQYFRLLHNSILFALSVLDPLGGVQRILLCTGKKEGKERQTFKTLNNIVC